MALFLPGTVFLNPAARQVFATGRLQLQDGLQLRGVTVAGSVNAGGGPLAVMDIGAAQDLFGRGGQLSRIDVRLKAGVDTRSFIESLQLPPGITATAPGDAAERVSNLSRAYRVNLTVLALVALFTGAFLVFSVLSLSVAKRAQQFALLGVLGLTGRERLQLVLIESLALGLVGSLAGIALGTALAALALRLLGGDLGGGYFSGVAPTLQWSGGGRADLRRAGRGGGRRGRLVAGAGGAKAAARANPQGAGPGARRRFWPLAEPCFDRRWRCAGDAAAGLRHSAGGLLFGRAAAGRRHHRAAVADHAALRPAQPVDARTACCRCWRSSARAGCAKARRWPSAAWSPRSAWRWR